MRRFDFGSLALRSAGLVVLAALALLPAAGCGSAGGERAGAAAAGLGTVLSPYETVRDLLAADRMDGLPEAAREMSAASRGLGEEVSATDPSLSAGLAAAARSAEALAAAPDLEQARRLFSPLSRDLVVLIQAHPSVRDDLHIFECPMVTGRFNKWVQPTADLQNPYMGTKMLKCGSEVSWSSVPVSVSDQADDAGIGAAAETLSGTGAPMENGARSGALFSRGDPARDHVATVADSGALSAGGGSAPDHSSEEEAHTHGHSAGGTDIAYYTCPMHPSVKQHDMGTCPLCGMDLVPVTREEVNTGVVLVDGARRQQIGVRLAPVELRPFSASVRTVGRVVYDETRLSDVTLRVGGWIGELFADAEGTPVRRGVPLFTLYSPELVSAQEEYLAALAAQREAQSGPAPGRADYLVEAARRRLALWDLDAGQIEKIVARGEPADYLPFLSPVSGYVVEKNLVAGAAVKPGERLFRIAGLDRVWIEADLYESQLSLARVGLPVEVTLPYLPGTRASGRVAFVYPYLDGGSRTGRVRIELDNPGLTLKPDMYADVEFRIEQEPRLSVPESAVIYAGDRRAVFVQVDEDRFQPRIVETGMSDGDRVEVLSGLEEGETVVASGNFLIAAESRLKTSMERWQ